MIDRGYIIASKRQDGTPPKFVKAIGVNSAYVFHTIEDARNYHKEWLIPNGFGDFFSIFEVDVEVGKEVK